MRTARAGSEAVLDRFQTEWCPASAPVRQRRTELGVDYVIRQVPAERECRDDLRAATGCDVVPTLRTESGGVISGEARILAFLGEHYVEPDEASAQRERAARARRRYLEKECACLEPPTR
jgi:glutathione S-transferase